MSEASHATIEAAEVTPEFVRRRVPTRRVIEVLDHGELVGGFLSRQELEHYRILVSRRSRSFAPANSLKTLWLHSRSRVAGTGLGVE